MSNQKVNKILVAEDDITNQILIKEFLSVPEYEVDIVADAEQVYSQTSEKDYDLILLDIMMPGGDHGFDVCTNLKKEEKTKSIPIIFITALNEDSDLAEGLKRGAVDYIKKPLSEIELKARINTHLRLSATEKKLKSEIEKNKQTQRKILNAIIQTEEKERDRFAQDLHDGLGPLLSTIKIYLKTLMLVKTPEKFEETHKNLQMTINEAINSIKEISNNISPHILHNFGLGSAIKSFTNRLIYSGEIKINLRSDLDSRFNEEVEVTLYRIVVELINNTVKHASATQIDIEVFQENKVLNLVYKDNGIGFEPESLDPKSLGMGLYNMQNRIKSLNGKIEFMPTQGKGVDVRVRVGMGMEL